MAICCEADYGEDDFRAFIVGTVAANFEELRFVTRVDVVSGGGTSVACEDGEVRAADSKSRAAIVSVPRNASSVRSQTAMPGRAYG